MLALHLYAASLVFNPIHSFDTNSYGTAPRSSTATARWSAGQAYQDSRDRRPHPGLQWRVRHLPRYRAGAVFELIPRVRWITFSN